VPVRACIPAYASLVFAAAAIALPAGVTYHPYPLPAFYQEWTAFAFGLLSAACLIVHPAMRALAPGRIVLGFLLLLGVVLVQAMFGIVAYTEQALLASLYLLWGAALAVSAGVLRDALGLARVCEVLAGALAAAAIFSALYAIVGHLAVPVDSGTRAVSARAFANFRQPNLFADYLCLGLASLSLLAARGRMGYGLLAVAATPILIAVALTQSRSAWMFLGLLLAVASWTAHRRGVALRSSASVIAALGYLMGVVLAYGAWSVLGQEPVPLQDRMLRTAAGVMARVELWQQAVEVFAGSPWMGAGFGQFAHERFWALRPAEHGASLGLYTHAHNIGAHILAELGLIAAVPLAGLLLWWVIENIRAAREPEHAWLLGVSGILIAHSLVEFPLWYAGFLGAFALVLGLGDTGGRRVTLRVGIWPAGAAVLLGATTLITSVADYRAVERLYDGPQGQVPTSTLVREAPQVPMRSLFLPYVELAYAGLLRIEADGVREAIALNGRLMRFMPDDHVVFRHALLLAQAGQAEEATRLLERAAAMYPSYAPLVAPLVARLASEQPERFAALLVALESSTRP